MAFDKNVDEHAAPDGDTASDKNANEHTAPDYDNPSDFDCMAHSDLPPAHINSVAHSHVPSPCNHPSIYGDGCTAHGDKRTTYQSASTHQSTTTHHY
jgi:hypothetical protein